MALYDQNVKRMRVSLETGELDFQVLRSAVVPEELTGFAARNNPRRGFLFVSKVLGKHWPVKPSVMRQTHTALAAKLRECAVDGPVFVVGMAETATALGRGVFEEFCAATGTEGLYCHTTRYRLERCRALCFSEEHCHASEHWLHLPQAPAEQAVLDRARTLVLVDDEMSTGTTFCNLIGVVKTVLPQLERIVVVTVLDMTGQAAVAQLQERFSCPVQGISLLEGHFSFQPRPDMCWQPAARSVGDGQNKDRLLPHAGGRTGVRPGQWDNRRLPHPPLPEGSVLVLGTGEFMYEPYRLALAMEEEGREVFFQATTRSPVLVGRDIGSALRFVDNYGENIDNFLYNVEKGQYGNILLCYEAATVPDAHDLPRRLGALCGHLTS